MIDLHTEYLGLSLRSPLVASAGPFTGDVDKLTEVEFQALNLLIDIPALGKPIPASRIVENMPSNGPLNAQHDALPVRRQSLDRILSVGTELVTALMSLERATR